jgi:hypothetical protein
MTAASAGTDTLADRADEALGCAPVGVTVPAPANTPAATKAVMMVDPDGCAAEVFSSYGCILGTSVTAPRVAVTTRSRSSCSTVMATTVVVNADNVRAGSRVAPCKPGCGCHALPRRASPGPTKYRRS